MNAACTGCEDVAARDALDRQDIGAVGAHRQREAGIDPPAVDQHGAGAALAAVAALLGSGQVQALAQQVEQRDARVVKLDVAPLAVDGEGDGVSSCSVPIGAMVEWNCRMRASERRPGRDRLMALLLGVQID